MKVSIGSRIIDGPWGGGNLFVVNFKKFLQRNGHSVIHDLCENDIDVILLTDPRSRKESSSTFNHEDILKYKKYVNPKVVVIQRINECDERKGTDFINQYYLNASECADHVIFVSKWLKNIFINIGMEEKKTSVIMSGADEEIFNVEGLSKFNKEKIKFVTHHWSDHANKGFDVYKQFDELLSEKENKNLEFTYIGNVPEDVVFKNVIVKKPLSGNNLAEEIKKNNIYITASKNEPSGNHHIEAAQCGLPILYFNSGGIPEYCDGYGLEFYDNFEEKLYEIIENFEHHKKKLKNYPFSAESMCEEFLECFNNIKANKERNDTEVIKILSNLFIFKNKVQKLLTTISIKQYLKMVLKKL
ncbi:glycosyltransferase [Candidatus Actinomarina]|nr:glycosyltransferase [Candidatus Actinomarina sp.]|tara:strand:+ start:14104 stop:15177 length:1074 start_codon:yes stop_codon:yes gene_type:complete